MMLRIEHIQVFDGVKFEQVFHLDDGQQREVEVFICLRIPASQNFQLKPGSFEQRGFAAAKGVGRDDISTISLDVGFQSLQGDAGCEDIIHQNVSTRSDFSGELRLEKHPVNHLGAGALICQENRIAKYSVRMLDHPGTEGQRNFVSREFLHRTDKGREGAKLTEVRDQFIHQAKG